MSILTLLFFFLGTIIGSFLNVVALRIERGTDFVRGRSACPQCHAVIAWYDNVPLISFVLLRGKCRSCQSPISWRYPLVELVTGLIYATTVACFFNPIETSAWVETVWLLGLFSLCIVIALYDWQTMAIPVTLLQMSALWTIVALFILDWFWSMSLFWSLDSYTFSGFIAAGIAWSSFALLSYFSRETWMGWGDAWLAAIIGLATGLNGVLFALTLGFGIGAVFSVGLLIRKKAEMETRVPFGPFLVMGLIVYFFLECLHIFPLILL